MISTNGRGGGCMGSESKGAKGQRGKGAEGATAEILHGDCLDVLPTFDDATFTACVTDPPYGLKFMGKDWDHGVPGESFWREVLRVLKPGAHLLAFGGTRTFHRLTCAIEDAGFEIRDCLMWVYGSGFPKSHDVSKAIDKAAGAPANEQNTAWVTAPATTAAAAFSGYGTALKPAWEPIILAMKPLDGTNANNAVTHGVAGLNIDGCRVGTTREVPRSHSKTDSKIGATGISGKRLPDELDPNRGRWPANVIHDGSDEVVEEFPVTASGAMKRDVDAYDGDSHTKMLRGRSGPDNQHGDSGSASRFFYCAKASRKERGEGNDHPTVKPIALMEYLCKLVTPPSGGHILDPFCGSGTTAIVAQRAGNDFTGIELEQDYVQIAQQRVANAAEMAMAV
jgi:DNA modification methylase